MDTYASVAFVAIWLKVAPRGSNLPQLSCFLPSNQSLLCVTTSNNVFSYLAELGTQL
jgi:hypothetical protein